MVSARESWFLRGEFVWAFLTMSCMSFIWGGLTLTRNMKHGVWFLGIVLGYWSLGSFMCLTLDLMEL